MKFGELVRQVKAERRAETGLEERGRGAVEAVPGLEFAGLCEEWVSEGEEKALIEAICRRREKWVSLKERRLQCYGGIVREEGTKRERLPLWLQQVCKTVVASGNADADPNHVLINEYQPGQGILPHTDGPLYHPDVVILSLGSGATMQFYQSYEAYTQSRPVASVYLPRRSLLRFSRDLYHNHLHTITEWTHDDPTSCTNGPLLRHTYEQQRYTRYSLTIRHVPNMTGEKAK